MGEADYIRYFGLIRSDLMVTSAFVYIGIILCAVEHVIEP